MYVNHRIDIQNCCDAEQDDGCYHLVETNLMRKTHRVITTVKKTANS